MLPHLPYKSLSSSSWCQSTPNQIWFNTAHSICFLNQTLENFKIPFKLSFSNTYQEQRLHKFQGLVRIRRAKQELICMVLCVASKLPPLFFAKITNVIFLVCTVRNLLIYYYFGSFLAILTLSFSTTVLNPLSLHLYIHLTTRYIYLDAHTHKNPSIIISPLKSCISTLVFLLIMIHSTQSLQAETFEF